MRPAVRIEEIDALRRESGIDDIDLRRAIDGLRVGDQVRLTFLAEPGLAAARTVRVRITRIRGRRFCGLLVEPAVGGDPPLPGAGSVAFTAGQIHSVATSRHAPGSAAPARRG